jgi:CBS domain-containing protein
MLLPLLLAVTISHAFTVLTLRRSILTEKVARRGYHLSREYSTDPLEILFVREVMRSNIVALPAHASGRELAASLTTDHQRRGQLLYPVVDDDRTLLGVVPRRALKDLVAAGESQAHGSIADIAIADPVVAYADEPLRMVVYRMAETGFTRMPVVERSDTRKLAGMISLDDLLRARSRSLEEERNRERVLRIHLPFGRRTVAG